MTADTVFTIVLQLLQLFTHTIFNRERAVVDFSQTSADSLNKGKHLFLFCFLLFMIEPACNPMGINLIIRTEQLPCLSVKLFENRIAIYRLNSR